MSDALDLARMQPFLAIVVLGLVCAAARALSAGEKPLSAVGRTLYVDISACFTGYVLLAASDFDGFQRLGGAGAPILARSDLLLVGAIALLLVVVATAKQRDANKASRARTDLLINAAVIGGLALLFFTSSGGAGTATASGRALWALEHYCQVQATDRSDPLARAASLASALFGDESPSAAAVPRAGQSRQRAMLRPSNRGDQSRRRGARESSTGKQEVISSDELCTALELVVRAKASEGEADHQVRRAQ